MGVGRWMLGIAWLAAGCASPTSGGGAEPAGARGDLGSRDLSTANARADLAGAGSVDGAAEIDLALSSTIDLALSSTIDLAIARDLAQCISPPLAVTCAGRCGMLADACGALVDCGTAQCVAPDTCGGGAGGPNACGCTDDRTACAVLACGTVVDNCGQMVSCGTCPSTAPRCCNNYCVSLRFVCPLD